MQRGYYSVKSLPVKKCGRPLLLGEELDTQVKHYIQAVREGGGVINTAITMAAATVIVGKTDRNLLTKMEAQSPSRVTGQNHSFTG